MSKNKVLDASNLASFVEHLDLGESKRFAECPWCGLGTQDNHFVATRRETYYLLYCFRCQRTKRLNNDKLPMSNIKHLSAQRRAWNNVTMGDTQNVEVNKVRLPQDYTANIPKEGLVWLSKYNISSEEREHFKIGYSPILNRVIVPVYQEDNLVYWQGRKLGELAGSPKWLNLKSKYSARPTMPILCEDSKHVVFVEDVISAIAVRRSGYSAVALLGTHLDEHLLSLYKDKEIIIWLDGDMKPKSQKFAKRMRAFGYKARAIVTHTKDPKEYKPEQIKKFIEGNTAS